MAAVWKMDTADLNGETGYVKDSNYNTVYNTVVVNPNRDPRGRRK
jgi:hypothetical protein